MKPLTEKPLSVLTIGTEILAKDLMDQFLRSLGPISTYYASRLEIALESYSKQRADIIFCELRFSNGSLHQFVQKIGGLNYAPDTYFVLVHDRNSIELEALQKELAIDEVLIKPFNADNMRAIVERAVQKLSGPKPPWATELKVAWEAERNKRFIEADNFFQRVHQKNSTVLEANLDVVKYWVQKNRLDPARNLLDRLWSENPKDPRVLQARASLLNRQGFHREALVLLEEAQHISPLNDFRAIEIAETYFELAGESVLAVVRADEFNSQAQLTTLKVLCANQDWGAAVSFCERKQNFINAENLKEFNAYLHLAKTLGKLK
jgi:tetratricopeptide (TPR) repeat protein